MEIDRNGGEREQRTDEHAELHAELLGRQRQVRRQRGEGRGGNGRIGDQTDELRTDIETLVV